MERSGQGADKIFRWAIEEGKGRPDYSRSDAYCVNLRLNAKIQDVQFLLFFEKIDQEKPVKWSVSDLILLDDIRQGKVPKPEFQDTLHRLREQGIIETLSRGRGTRYILSKKFYTFVGEKGIYTRRKGLDKEEKKALIIKHLQEHKKGYIHDFEQLLPTLRRAQIHTLLINLKQQGKIRHLGGRKFGYWELVT